MASKEIEDLYTSLTTPYIQGTCKDCGNGTLNNDLNPGAAMTYTLNFISKFGLWELRIDHFRLRFYRTRDAAMKTVTRYRQMLKSEQDRYQSARGESAIRIEWR
jgi:hypothetical protein